MIKTGHAGQVYTDTAVRHVLMRQGVVGIKVSIFLPQDPTGQLGPKIPLDDVCVVIEPKEDVMPQPVMMHPPPSMMAPVAMEAVPPPVMVDPAQAAGF